MSDTPETIYLIPGEDIDGAPCMVWCDDPAPSYACDPAEAVKYIRADKHQEIIDRQAKAARMGMDAAKKSAHIMEESAKKMRAESNPAVIESERAANAILTEEAERLTAQLAQAEGRVKDLEDQKYKLKHRLAIQSMHHVRLHNRWVCGELEPPEEEAVVNPFMFAETEVWWCIGDEADGFAKELSSEDEAQRLRDQADQLDGS